MSKPKLPQPPQKTPAPKQASAKDRAIVRKDGRHLRRLTIYLGADLAHRLRMFCALTEREHSEVVTVGLDEYLASKGS